MNMIHFAWQTYKIPSSNVSRIDIQNHWKNFIFDLLERLQVYIVSSIIWKILGNEKIEVLATKQLKECPQKKKIKLL